MTEFAWNKVRNFCRKARVWLSSLPVNISILVGCSVTVGPTLLSAFLKLSKYLVYHIASCWFLSSFWNRFLLQAVSDTWSFPSIPWFANNIAVSADIWPLCPAGSARKYDSLEVSSCPPQCLFNSLFLYPSLNPSNISSLFLILAQSCMTKIKYIYLFILMPFSGQFRSFIHNSQTQQLEGCCLCAERTLVMSSGTQRLIS